jgi:hypothetical protein
MLGASDGPTPSKRAICLCPWPARLFPDHQLSRALLHRHAAAAAAARVGCVSCVWLLFLSAPPLHYTYCAPSITLFSVKRGGEFFLCTNSICADEQDIFIEVGTEYSCWDLDNTTLTFRQTKHFLFKIMLMRVRESESKRLVYDKLETNGLYL